MEKLNWKKLYEEFENSNPISVKITFSNKNSIEISYYLFEKILKTSFKEEK